jgi:alpha-beta hydrolase superfamily lysophospholipase
MAMTRISGAVAGSALITLTLLLPGCSQGGRPKADLAATQVSAIGVNAFLWRASLETLAFMPMLQVDSAGGVILTDWYTNPKATGERMKLTVTILDASLRADALRVAASRQTLQNQQWVDAPIKAATTQKLEEIILTRARDLRRRALEG